MNKQNVNVSFSFTDGVERHIKEVFEKHFGALNFKLEIKRLTEWLLKCDVAWRDPFDRIAGIEWSLTLDANTVNTMDKIAVVMGNFMLDAQRDLQAHAGKKIQSKRRADARAKRIRRK